MIEPVLKELRSLGSVEQEARDLLAEPVAEHAAHVERWRRDGVDGVVFALCDAGVSAPTQMLAAAAEAAGIPCVVICTGDVVDLIAGAAAFQAPGLPLVVFAGRRFDSPEQLADSARAIAPEVVAGLTTDAASLLRRFEERFPYGGSLARREGHPLPSEQDFPRYAQERHMTDGFPVHAPTRSRVAALIDHAQREPSEVLVSLLNPSGAAVTVEQAAICAAMAGALPSDFPFILAALDLMSQPRFKLYRAVTTTHPGGNLLLFSGPAADAAGITSGKGCLGPNQRANLTIGRAVALTLLNVGRAVPGLSTLGQMGSPAQLSCCFADRADGALPPLYTTLGNGRGTIAWGMHCEAPHNLINHLSTSPESLLRSYCSVGATLGGNNAFVPNDLLLIMNPEHAEVVVRAGWTRDDIRRFVWENARNDRAALQGLGLKPEWPAEWASFDRIPVVPSPDKIWVVVAGSGGPQAMVAMPWMSQACWTTVNV